jgi:two-component system, response regulator / RNA-binding antiterminator
MQAAPHRQEECVTGSAEALGKGLAGPRRTVQLRILLANERRDRLDVLADVILGMGHTVIGRETDVVVVGPLTARIRPDVAIVGLGESSQHALDHVSAIVREAYCPVIAVLPAHDPVWVEEASKRGLYAYLLDERPAELQSALDITLRRFAEYQVLQGAFNLRIAAAAEEARQAEARKRQVLELHEEVVQGLVVAQLAFDLGHEDELRKALASTLAQARAMVTRELTDLQEAGHPLDELIGDAASSRNV